MGHEPALVLAYARPAEWWRGGVGLAYDAGAGPSGNVLVHGGRGRHRRGGQKRGGTGVGGPRGCWLWPSGPRWPRSQGALEAGQTTVGVRVELEHLAPSVVWAELEIAAVLERVAGRRLEFAVRVRDGGRLVARGMVTRLVVDTAAFLPDAGGGGGG